MSEFYEKAKKLLRENGFSLLRHGKGDHEIWSDASDKVKVTIFKNLRSRNTVNQVLKDAGIDKKL
jgi:predicted RNA binding protein YcfA (HicA-like mRNA interferase family)